jgi:hypothetical protein
MKRDEILIKKTVTNNKLLMSRVLLIFFYIKLDTNTILTFRYSLKQTAIVILKLFKHLPNPRES